MVRHPFEGIRFDAEPIARVILKGRILLERENAVPSVDPIDAAVATAPDSRNAQQRFTDKFPCDIHLTICGDVSGGQETLSPR
jgi:hypothetical protein